MNIKERVDALLSLQGSLRAVEKITGVNYAYLHRLSSGEKINPSDLTLRKLGLKKIVTYEIEGKKDV